MTPAVSVVIPSYRQAHFLPEAVDSALDQSLGDVEVIVVDDGSPDDVAGALGDRFRVRLLTQENRGLSGARHRGLAEARAPYVLFLDSDDRLLPDALSTLVGALDGHPDAGLAWGFNRPIDRDGEPVGGLSNPWPSDHAGYEDLLRRNVVGPPAGVMFRRALLDRLGGFQVVGHAGEDYEAYLRIARHAGLRCVGKVVAEYRYHGANMSADHANMLHGVLAVLELQAPHVRGNRRLERALATGRRDAWRRYDGEPRVEVVRESVHAGRWARAAAEGLALGVRYPSLLLGALAGTARRLSRSG